MKTRRFSGAVSSHHSVERVTRFASDKSERHSTFCLSLLATSVLHILSAGQAWAVSSAEGEAKIPQANTSIQSAAQGTQTNEVADKDSLAQQESNEGPDTEDSLPELSSDFFTKERKIKEEKVEEAVELVRDTSVQLAQQESAEARADFITNSTVSYFSDQIISTVDSWFSRLGTSELNLDISTTGVTGDFDVLVPFNPGSADSRYFGQFGASINDDSKYSGRSFVNVGGGYRKIVESDSIGPYMFGINNFYDFDVTRGHVRSSIGGEFVLDSLKTTVNTYFPITGWKDSPDTFAELDDLALSERAAYGYDINFEGYFPAYPQFHWGLSASQFFGDYVESSSGGEPLKNPMIYEGSVEYKPFPLLSFGVGVTSEDSEVEGNVDMSLNYNFGQSIESQLEPTNVGVLNDLYQGLDDIVTREKNIRLEYALQETLSIGMSPVYHLPESQEFVLDPGIVASYELTSVQYSGSFVDAFMDNKPTADNPVAVFDVTDAYAEEARNIYELKLRVEDEKGNVVTSDSQVVVEIDSSLAPRIIMPDDAVVGQNDTGTLSWTFENPRNPNKVVRIPASFEYSGLAARALDDHSLFEPTWHASALTAGSGPYELTITATDDLGHTASESIQVGVEAQQAKIISLIETTVGVPVYANGTDEARLEYQVVDIDDGSTPVEGVPVFVSSDATAHVTVTNSNAQGIGFVDVTNTASGISTVKVAVQGDNTGGIPKDIMFEADPATSGIRGGSLAARVDSVVADGATKMELSAVVVDQYDNAVEGVEATISNLGNASVVGSAVQSSDKQGVVKFDLTSVKAETINPVVTVLNSSDTAEFEFVGNPLTAETISVTVIDDQIVANGTALALVEAEVKDENGNILADQPVNWDALSGNVALSFSETHTNKDGKARTTLSSETPGTYKVYAYPRGLSGPNSQVDVTFIVDNGMGAHFEKGTADMLVNDQPVTTGSNANFNEARIRVIDGLGNPVDKASVNWSVSNPDFTLQSSSSETDSDGYAVGKVSSKVAGNGTITATMAADSSITETLDVNFVAVAGDAIIAAPTHPAGDNPADNKTVVYVELEAKDSNGTPVSDIEIDWFASDKLSLIGGDSALFSTGMSTTTGSDGKTKIGVKSNASVLGTVTARYQDESVDVPVEFIADTQSAVMTEKQDQMGDAGNNKSALLKVSLRDYFGNPITNQGFNVTPLEADTLVVNPSDKTNKDGEVVFELTSNVAGTKSVTLTAPDLNALSTTTKVTFISGGDRPVNIQQISNDTTGDVIADGTAVIELSSVLTNVSDGNPADDMRVYWSVIDPDSSITAAEHTNDLGETSATVTSTTPGPKEVVLTSSDKTETITVTFVSDAGSAEFDTVNTDKPEAVADGKDTMRLTAYVTDAQGHAVPEIDVALDSSSLGTSGSADATNKETDVNGMVYFDIQTTNAGTIHPQLTITSTGQTYNSTDVTFIADDQTAVVDTISAVVDGVNANGSAKAKVQARVLDGNDNEVPGHKVDWSVTGDAQLIHSSSYTDDAGIAEVELVGHSAGQVRVVVHPRGINQGYTDETSVSFVNSVSGGVKPEPGSLTMLVDGQNADGNKENVVRVRVIDEDGSPVDGAAVTWTADNKSFNFGSTANVITDAEGWAEGHFFSVSEGEGVVTAEVNGTQEQVDAYFSNATPEVTVSLEGASADVVADGTATGAMVIEVTDLNSAPAEGLEVVWSSTHPVIWKGSHHQRSTVHKSVTNAQGRAEAVFTSQKAGTATIEAMTVGGNQSASINFVSDVTTLEFDTELVSVGNVAVNESSELKVVVTDAGGNLLDGVGFEITPADPANTQVLNESDVTDAQGEVIYEFTSGIAGSQFVTLTAKNAPNNATEQVNVMFVDGAREVDLGNVNEITTGGTVVADGQSAIELEVGVTNVADGSVAKDVAVYWSVADTASSLDPAHAITSDKGIAATKLTSTTPGVKIVTVMAGDKTVTKDVTFVADSATAAVVRVTPDKTQVVADGTDSVLLTVEVNDDNGHPVDQAEVTVDSGSLGSATAVNTSVDTTADGLAVFELHSGTADTIRPKFQVAGSAAFESQAVEFIADAASAEVDSIDTVVDDVLNNGSAKAKVEALITDSQGNLLKEHKVEWSSHGLGQLTQTASYTDEQGIASVGVTSERTGDVEVTVYPQGQGQGGEDQTTVTFVDSNSDGTQFESGSLAMLVDGQKPGGTARNSVQVRIVDANGDPVDNEPVTWGSAGGEFAFDHTTTNTGADGWVVASFSSADPVSDDVIATLPNHGKEIRIPSYFDDEAAEVTVKVSEVTSHDVVADGSEVATMKVQATDANGDAVEGVTVSWQSSQPVVWQGMRQARATAVTTKTDANGYATIAFSSVKAGEATVTAATGTSSDSDKVRFIADMSTAQFNLLSSSDAKEWNKENALLTIHAADRHGNPVEGLDPADFEVTTSSGEGSIISYAATEKSQGEYELEIELSNAGVAYPVTVRHSATASTLMSQVLYDKVLITFTESNSQPAADGVDVAELTMSAATKFGSGNAFQVTVTADVAEVADQWHYDTGSVTLSDTANTATVARHVYAVTTGTARWSSGSPGQAYDHITHGQPLDFQQYFYDTAAYSPMVYTEAGFHAESGTYSAFVKGKAEVEASKPLKFGKPLETRKVPLEVVGCSGSIQGSMQDDNFALWLHQRQPTCSYEPRDHTLWQPGSVTVPMRPATTTDVWLPDGSKVTPLPFEYDDDGVFFTPAEMCSAPAGTQTHGNMSAGYAYSYKWDSTTTVDTTYGTTPAVAHSVIALSDASGRKTWSEVNIMIDAWSDYIVDYDGTTVSYDDPINLSLVAADARKWYEASKKPGSEIFPVADPNGGTNHTKLLAKDTWRAVLTQGADAKPKWVTAADGWRERSYRRYKFERGVVNKYQDSPVTPATEMSNGGYSIIHDAHRAHFGAPSYYVCK